VAIVAPILMGSFFASSSLHAMEDDTKAAAFKTVTIRASQPDHQPPGVQVLPTGFETENLTLRDVVGWAYNVQVPLVSGPATLDAYYDITAELPKDLLPMGGYPVVDGVRPTVRKMLSERFSLQAHFAKETRSVYVLTGTGGGPGWKEDTAAVGPWRDG